LGDREGPKEGAAATDKAGASNPEGNKSGDRAGDKAGADANPDASKPDSSKPESSKPESSKKVSSKDADAAPKSPSRPANATTDPAGKRGGATQQGSKTP
jgi:hypothetical protein